jgi:hypothetical protein
VNIYECVTVSSYSFREQADMNFTYFHASGNGRDAARHQTFAAGYRHLAETGRLAPVIVDRGRQRVACAPDLQQLDVEHVAWVPGGTRQLAAAFPFGHMAVWRVLHEQLRYPYHSKRVQGLTPAVNPTRENR